MARRSGTAECSALGEIIESLQGRKVFGMLNEQKKTSVLSWGFPVEKEVGVMETAPV